MVLIVSRSSRISPLASAVIFFERSPFATAVVTSAMFRTWPVRFEAIKFTLSVRSFHVPETPFTCACPKLRHHRVHRFCGAEELSGERPAVDFERHRLVEVAVCNGADYAGHLGIRLDEIHDERVDRVDAAFPGAAGAGDRCSPSGL